MSRTGRIVLGIIAVGVVVAVVVLVYLWISGGSGQASAPISAPTLEPQAVEVADATEAAAAAGNGIVFEIVPAESEVRFIIDEDLFGQPNEVIGRTDQVAGQLFVNFDTPPQSRVGAIRVNVRTLATDNEFRNRTLRSRILESSNDAYEFAQFTPTGIEGLPNTVTMGEPLTFTVTGDLQVRDIMQPVTFSVTLTPVSETRLEGLATATVLRDDYGLAIPNAPGVANVGEEVRLEIEFVAHAAQGS